jgi:hypothetical protein
MYFQFIRNIFKILIITIIIGLGMLTSVHANPDRPVAVAESGSYDFGTALDGSPIIHDYIIKNTGSANLEIQKVKSG